MVEFPLTPTVLAVSRFSSLLVESEISLTLVLCVSQLPRPLDPFSIPPIQFVRQSLHSSHIQIHLLIRISYGLMTT